MNGAITITYEPATMCGTRGHWYRVHVAGRLIGEGWTAGRRSHAEAEARAFVVAKCAA